MALISHEIPKQLFPFHDLINDYPYVLAHLLNKDPEYSDFYGRKLKSSFFSILDNSAFELGESIDMKLLMDLAEQYKPTHIVIPDKVNDCDSTINKFDQFLSYIDKSGNSPFSYIGVVQGKSFDEITRCLKRYIASYRVSLYAFPFDLVPDSEFVTVRYRYFKWLLKYEGPNVLNHIHNRVHLLGCYNPVEFQLFKEDDKLKALIHSLDTSSPIINGWEGNKFGDHGMVGNKPKDKLADNLDIKLSFDQIEKIVNNIIQVRDYVEG